MRHKKGWTSAKYTGHTNDLKRRIGEHTRDHLADFEVYEAEPFDLFGTKRECGFMIRVHEQEEMETHPEVVNCIAACRF